MTFDNFLIYFEAYDTLFDVIMLSETHPIYDNNDFKITGYETISNYSFLNRCDGYIVYVKSSIFVDYSVIKINGHNFLRVLINKNENKMDIFGNYRSPSLNRGIFVNGLEELLSGPLDYKVETSISIADININLLKYQDKGRNEGKRSAKKLFGSLLC